MESPYLFVYFRLYSDFMFLKLGLRTSKGFHDAVGFSTNYLKFCMKNRTIESCVYDRQYISMYKVFISCITQCRHFVGVTKKIKKKFEYTKG